MTEEATENVDGFDMFVQAQLLKESPAVLASMTSRPANISHQEYEKKPSVIPTPHSFACSRRASNRTSDQSSGSEHQQWATTTKA